MGLLDFLSGGRYKRAEQLGREASQIFADIQLPDIERMRLQLEGIVQQGVYTPEQADAILQEQTGFNRISTDPRLQQAQMEALRRLQGLSETGMDITDRARLFAISQAEGARSRGEREAILQNAAARGLSGSGLELAAQLGQQQGAATRGAAEGFGVAEAAQQRALQALQGAGGLAGQIRGQSFEEQAQRARAQDIINQFNTRQRQDVVNMNLAERNRAFQQNLTERQRVADQNAALRNQQQQYNKELLQRQFQNRMARAVGQAGALQNAAAQLTNQGSQGVDLFGGLIGSAAGGAMTGIGYGLTKK